ncbi:hypothetical protein FWG86_02450 [Candidatus Saccharibacteria bacterium]|nr:hypothetical protein [Candidatus Saccharibacteria bacterium]
MFEINLVPQIKRDALKTQKIRNLVIASCILIGTVCGVLLAIFGTTYGVQRAITTARTAQIEENYEALIHMGDDLYDLRYYLTLQNQLAELGEIGEQKTLFSRVLGIVSDVVPRHPITGEPTIQFTELNYNATSFRVSFDAQSIFGFEALHALEATLARLYYDYGVYRNGNTNEELLPCSADDTANCFLREELDTEPNSPTRGIIYGVVLAQNGSELRVYRNGDRNEAGFYFDSACLGADGMTSNCKLILGEPDTDEPPSYEINTGGTPTLRFKMSFEIDPPALNIQSRHVRVLGIVRQDVTDSFLQINNGWFAAAPTNPEEDL